MRTMMRKKYFSRRVFLSRTLMLAGSTLGSSALVRRIAAQAAGAPRAIGLGFSLYGMRSLALDAALAAVARIGYDCVELPVMNDWPADSARLNRAARASLREALARQALRLTSLMENLPALGDDAQHRANVERLKQAAQLAHDLAPAGGDGAAGQTPLIETILGGRPGEFERVKERLVERLSAWAEVAAEATTVVAIKAHVGNAIQRPEQLLWLLTQVASPWLKAAYDYSHFQLQGLDMAETMQAMLPQTVFVHVKDTEHALGKRGFLLPGEGSIDYAELFRRLGQSSYRGDVMVEVSSQVSNRPGYDPLAAARKCYDHLAAAFRQAGLRA
jgi:inosose dehydratase